MLNECPHLMSGSKEKWGGVGGMREGEKEREEEELHSPCKGTPIMTQRPLIGPTLRRPPSLTVMF